MRAITLICLLSIGTYAATAPVHPDSFIEKPNLVHPVNFIHADSAPVHPDHLPAPVHPSMFIEATAPVHPSSFIEATAPVHPSMFLQVDYDPEDPSYYREWDEGNSGNSDGANESWSVGKETSDSQHNEWDERSSCDENKNCQSSSKRSSGNAEGEYEESNDSSSHTEDGS